MSKFNKQEAEHEMKRMELEAKLTQPFALKMASLICFSVLSVVVLLGMFFGDKTPFIMGLVLALGIGFALISFRITYSSCL